VKRLFFCFFMLFSFSLQASFPTGYEEELLGTAEEAFRKGEHSQDVEEQRELFNVSLDAYLTFLKQNPEYFGAHLMYNLGNTYFHLKEYSLASLYYHKALKLQPRHKKILANLKITEEALGFKKGQVDSLLEQVFTLNYWSFKEQNVVFLLIIFLLFCLYSFSLFKPVFKFVLLKRSLLILFFLLFSVLTKESFAPTIEGIVLKESRLHHDAGEKYVKSDAPVLKKGQKVAIIQIDQTNTWVMIRTQTKKEGFCPFSEMGVI
jgi:tetratricopeptide (TPR) repeat protein